MFDRVIHQYLGAISQGNTSIRQGNISVIKEQFLRQFFSYNTNKSLSDIHFLGEKYI